MKYSNKSIAIFSLSVLLFGAIGAFIAIYRDNISRRNILKQPQKYCYDTSRHVINPAFILSTLDFKNELINYYNTISKKPDATPIIPFSITGLPQKKPVYIIGYTDDSLMVEVVCYYDRGPSYANKEIRGWVYYKTLHDTPPPDSKNSRELDLLEVIEIYKKQEAKKDSLKKELPAPPN